MDRAIAYIRVSTDRQATDGTSLGTQERKVDEYVERKEYELDRLFAEEGESAKTDGRPILQEMLAYCRKNRGHIQVLVFPKIDRFARYTEDYHFLKRDLRNLGIRVESTDERFDDSPSGRFMENVLAAQAQYDNDVRSERAKGAMKEGVTEGRWINGHAPKGFRNTMVGNKPTIEPDPSTAPIIAEAFERMAWKGFRPQDVRRWLASKGIVYSTSGFDGMLKNKIYIGIIEAFGLVVQAKPPLIPIVSEATFYKARGAVRAHVGPKTHQRDSEDFPLRGTLRCGCGSFLTASWSRGRRKKYAYYRCKACRSVNLPRTRAHQAFVTDLRGLKRAYGLTKELRQDLLHEWKKEQLSAKTRQSSLEQELYALSELQGAIVLKNSQGVIPDSVAKEQLAELTKKVGEKKARLAESKPGGPAPERVLNFANEFLTGLDQHWRKCDLPAKKHIQAFFYPTGAIVGFGQSRTAKNRHFTGSALPIGGPFSASARPSSESPNRSSKPVNTPKITPEMLLQTCRKMFEEFGNSSQPIFGRLANDDHNRLNSVD